MRNLAQIRSDLRRNWEPSGHGIETGLQQGVWVGREEGGRAAGREGGKAANMRSKIVQ